MSKAGWSGLIGFGKKVSSRAAVAVDEVQRPPAASAGMQDDEAGAVGEEIGERHAVGLHGEPAGRLAADAHRVGEAAVRAAAEPVIVDGESCLAPA